MYKRIGYNHALTWSIRKANELKLPLVVYEGLKYYYPWANDRLHTFILEGVEEKRRGFDELGIRYIFYLQKDRSSPKRIVARLAKDAALIVTDDYPCFIIPEHNKRIASRAKVPVQVVDSNGIIPMSKSDKEEYAAYTIRPKISKLLPDYLKSFPDEKIQIESGDLEVDCPDTLITADNIVQLVSECDIDHSVKPSQLYHGGTANARKRSSPWPASIATPGRRTESLRSSRTGAIGSTSSAAARAPLPEIECPTIIETTSSALVVFASTVPTVLPSRRTVTASQIVKISSMRCET